MPEDPLELIGSTLDERFRVDSLVEEGELSLTYRGHDVKSDSPVAIRCLNVPISLDRALLGPFVETFDERTRQHQKLAPGNPAFVQILGSGSATAQKTGQKISYEIREWLDATTLTAYLAKRQAEHPEGLPLDDVLRLLEPVAEGLAYAQGKGVTHGELNPNHLVVIERKGSPPSVKIIDFGGVRARDGKAADLPKLRLLLPDYTAPEQIDKQLGVTGHWTDVYALAVMVVECLAGKLFAKNVAAAVASLPENRPTPTRLGVKLPALVTDVLEQALALEPNKRPPNVATFWKRLKEASVATPAAGAPAPASRPGQVTTQTGAKRSIATQPIPKRVPTAPSAPRVAPAAESGPKAGPAPESSQKVAATDPMQKASGTDPMQKALATDPMQKAGATDPTQKAITPPPRLVTPAAKAPPPVPSARPAPPLPVKPAPAAPANGLPAGEVHEAPAKPPTLVKQTLLGIQPTGPLPPPVETSFGEEEAPTRKLDDVADAPAAPASGAPPLAASGPAPVVAEMQAPPAAPAASAADAPDDTENPEAFLPALVSPGLLMRARDGFDWMRVRVAAGWAVALPWVIARAKDKRPVARVGFGGSIFGGCLFLALLVRLCAGSGSAKPASVVAAATASVPAASASAPAEAASAAPSPASSSPEVELPAETASAPPPPPREAAAFTKAAAVAALEAAGADIASCRKQPGGAFGPGSIRATFGKTGSVVRITIGPPYADTPLGACIMEHFGAAQMPPFRGNAGSINYAFNMPK